MAAATGAPIHLSPQPKPVPKSLILSWSGLSPRLVLPPPLPHCKTLTLSRIPLTVRSSLSSQASDPFPGPRKPNFCRVSTAIAAGRSKKKPGGPSPGRIEGGAEVRRAAKAGARRRSLRLARNLFYRRNQKTSPNHPDHFTEEELEMIGLGYDRAVRFMAPDDPRLRHPHDWYKYGQYGPYSWRGIVVGPPIRGRFSDERVTLISEVRNHEEFEEIERFEMSSEFSERLESLDRSIGFRYYWVFVRHPKWKASELPWQQWTLVSEVVLEASKKERLNKWSLMGRLGNKSRAMITQCAAWMRPDIIYVKRPVYQCRFEPQDDFFKLLAPLVDPETENEYLFDLEREDGRLEMSTYFGALCKMVKISPKAYVDDVVNAYEKLSDGGKSKCLEFLLMNHPLDLLHPYTKEWKVKLEEMELGCDAPDESDDDSDKTQITDWIEEDDEGGMEDGEEEGEEEEDDGEVIDLGDGDQLGGDGASGDPEESPEYWDEQWKKAMRNPEAMENLVRKSVQKNTELYKRQIMDEQNMAENTEDRGTSTSEDSSTSTTVVDSEQGEEQTERFSYRDYTRRVKKSKIPPELFLRAAVRPFTYRNLVKEIVLTRHAIVDGDISVKC